MAVISFKRRSIVHFDDALLSLNPTGSFMYLRIEVKCFGEFRNRLSS